MGSRRTINLLGAWFVGVCALCMCMAQMSVALPEGRHYEMVSPLFKGGYNAKQLYGAAMAGSGEGDRVAFVSVGSFVGAGNNSLLTPYIARRNATGWSTESMMPPAALLPNATLWDLTPSLEWAVFTGETGSNNGVAQLESPEGEVVLHNLTVPDAEFSVAGMPVRTVTGKHLEVLSPLGTNPSFCHVVVGVGQGSVGGAEEALLPEALHTNAFLYDLATGAPGCNEEAKLRLLSVRNELGPNKEPKVLNPSPDRKCISFLGASSITEGTAFNAISADGRTIFFETALEPTECEEFSIRTNNPLRLFARLNGEKTIEVANPIAADCEEKAQCRKSAPQRVEFAGADPTGTRVFFTTMRSLVTGDTDSTLDLYMAEIGCPASTPGCAIAEREVTALRQISHVSTGEPAEVQGIVTISPDGSHLYFVAHGVLGQEGPKEAGAQTAPVSGADNLYVYDASDGTTKFVADLCSGPDSSGSVNDSRCPLDLDSSSKNDQELWGVGGSEPKVQTTNDGRFLLFTSYGRLAANDTDAAADVYRYDAQTGGLDRVSIGEAGADANGNGELNAQIPMRSPEDFALQEYGLARRAISEDGSRVVFETPEPLSQAATNGLVNAYEWHKEPEWNEGRVALVSKGSDPEPVGVEPEGRSLNIVITPSGNDIFFITADGLLQQDTDGESDVYDARIGPGFPPVEAQQGPCHDEGCQGPLTNPAPLLVPGSVQQVAGENIRQGPSKPASAKKGKRKKKRRRHQTKHKRRRTMGNGRNGRHSR